MPRCSGCTTRGIRVSPSDTASDQTVITNAAGKACAGSYQWLPSVVASSTIDGCGVGAGVGAGAGAGGAGAGGGSTAGGCVTTGASDLGADVDVGVVGVPPQAARAI